MTSTQYINGKSLLTLVSLTFALCTTGSAAEPVSVSLLQGWYMVEGGEPDGALRARMFGEYHSGGKVQYGRNVLTYHCKKGWRDYLRINLAPEVEHMIATVKQDIGFRFSDRIMFVSNGSKSEWVAWFDAESDSAVIEFPDSSDELIKRRFDLIIMLSDNFSVMFGPLDGSPVPFTFVSPEKTRATIEQLEEGFNKKLQVQDRAQFLNYCIQIQF